jgi:carboxylate-amine ligase
LLISGLHVHVGVDSGEKAIAVANSVVSYLPHMVALSASSPFWHSADTGLQSCRSKVFDALPKGGIPPFILNWAEFVRLMRTLLNSGTVDSVRDIWWDVRPHVGFGTVEIRICDALPTLRENIAMVALAQALVVNLGERYDQGHPLPVLNRWTLVENKWRAIRHGLDARLIRNESGDLVPIVDHLRETIELLKPTAERLGSLKELEDINTIIECGNSATRQRRIWEETHDMNRVVDALIWEFGHNQITEPGQEKAFFK